MKNKSPKAIAVAPLALGALIAFFSGIGPSVGGESTAVIAWQARWEIDPRKIDCLSLNRKIPNQIFGSDYSENPQILTVLHLRFPKIRVSADDPSCRYILTFNINAEHLNAARLHGRPAKILASLVIDKRPIADTGPRTSSYKNIYIFRDDLTPIQIFEVGLSAFLQPQDRPWQTIAVALPSRT